MKAKFPSACLQHHFEPWWVRSEANQPTRGALLRAFVPHVDQRALVLVSEGRAEPTVHETAAFRIAPFEVRNPPVGARLPVAGLPHYPEEVRTVHRAKRRPVLVLSTGGVEVSKELRQGSLRHQTSPTLLVAPYYGVEKSARRAGWAPAFVDRIRLAEYPQYLLDRLPLGGAEESILRLDHVQPVGKHGDNYELTGHALSPDGLYILDEWLYWLIRGEFPEGSVLHAIRRDLMSGPEGAHQV